MRKFRVEFRLQCQQFRFGIMCIVRIVSTKFRMTFTMTVMLRR